MWSARRESQLESGPREAGGSNPSRCHETESRRENGLMSTTYKRHAERMRTCFAQVLGKAGTDPLDRDRRRTEANDVEWFLTSCRDHGVPWKHRECQTKLICAHRHVERKQVDAHLQTSDVASHDSRRVEVLRNSSAISQW